MTEGYPTGDVPNVANHLTGKAARANNHGNHALNAKPATRYTTKSAILGQLILLNWMNLLMFAPTRYAKCVSSPLMISSGQDFKKVTIGSVGEAKSNTKDNPEIVAATFWARRLIPLTWNVNPPTISQKANHSGSAKDTGKPLVIQFIENISLTTKKELNFILKTSRFV